MESSHSIETKASTKGTMVVSKADLADSETDPMEDSELTKEEDSNVDSMGSATIVANTDTKLFSVDLNE